MTAGAASPLLLAPADTARAIAGVYTASVLATLPIALAAALALGWRRVGSAARAAVWRITAIVVLVVFIGRQLPLHWLTFDVPSLVALPLVALGRIQMSAAPGAASAWLAPRVLLARSDTTMDIVLVAYVIGVLLILVPTGVGIVRARRIARAGVPLRDTTWRSSVRRAMHALDAHREPRVVMSPAVEVPMTWGLWRPVIALPAGATHWSEDRRRMVLLHETGHVQRADWVFGLVARLVCALFWFHPGVWWLAAALREDAEHACDDRVMASGIRRSEYAELLLSTAAPPSNEIATGVPLSGRHGLRGRLATVLDMTYEVRSMGRAWTPSVALIALALAVLLSGTRLAPTRDVLSALMQDGEWRSRAYAVVGLAQRADTIAVARTAAALDPSPRVRAWARYALGLRDTASERREPRSARQ